MTTPTPTRGSLEHLPAVYCLVCGRRARSTGPCQTTCPTGHRVDVLALSVPAPPGPPGDGCETWRDRPAQL
jgi:hypothetical protein